MSDMCVHGRSDYSRLLNQLGMNATPQLRAELDKLKDGLQALDQFAQRHGGGGLEEMFGHHMAKAMKQLACALSCDGEGGGAQRAGGSGYDPHAGGFEECDDGDPDAPGASAKGKALKKAMKAIASMGGAGGMMGMMGLGMMMGGLLKGIGQLFGGGGPLGGLMGGGGPLGQLFGGGGGGGNQGQSFNPLNSNASDVGGAGPKYGKKRLPPELEALMHGGGGLCFEDLVAKFMIDTVKQMQNEAKAKMDEIKKSIKSKESGGGGGGGAGGAGGAGGGGGAGGAEGGQQGGDDSRNLMFEELKYIMQKLSQVQQALSNVLNTMHEQAMSSIRHIKV